MEEGLLGTLQTYVLPHWPFVFMSFALGTMGQFFKKKVWTFERAKTSKFWMLMYTTLGVHAPLMGACLGALGAPVSPGIDNTWLARALYHFGAGAMASWTFAAFAHFMRSRGIVLAESMVPPPNTCKLNVNVGGAVRACGLQEPCPLHSIERKPRDVDENAPTVPPPIGHSAK